jgi:hypothetical protein
MEYVQVVLMLLGEDRVERTECRYGPSFGPPHRCIPYWRGQISESGACSVALKKASWCPLRGP